MHLMGEYVPRQYWRTLSCCLLRKMFVMLPSPCYEIDYRGPTAPRHAEREQAGLTHRNKSSRKTDRWTHWNYLKGGYGEEGVGLFSGKGWGLIDTRRNICTTYKENIPQLVWPVMGARAQRSCGLSILGGNANTASWGPEQTDSSRADPALSWGILYMISRGRFWLT